MKTITFKLPDNLYQLILGKVSVTGQTKTEILRQAVRAYFSNESIQEKGTFGALAQDLCGKFEGPEDLSTNNEFFNEYGKSAD